MRIYTRTGDDGNTGLFGGQRVSKDALRVEAYGTVDELNAVLGLARIHTTHAPAADPNALLPAMKTSVADIDALMQRIQNDLFGLGSDLATPQEQETTRGRVQITRTSPQQVSYLETQIDLYEDELPPLTNFILPGGCALAAALHHARVVCRRAERRTVTTAHAEVDNGGINPEVIHYLNRLSDLLFVLSRVANHRHSIPDIVWKS